MKYKTWGKDIDPEARSQMDVAMSLPNSIAGALMPDAHVGYGLPIGGVLATENAVIPYGVGVDIACRMMMTIFDVPPTLVKTEHDLLISLNSTSHGAGRRMSRKAAMQSFTWKETKEFLQREGVECSQRDWMRSPGHIRTSRCHECSA